MIGTFFHALSAAAPKIHVTAFGKWMTVQWVIGTAADDKAVTLKIRPLVIDGRVKEYVVGAPHEVSDRLFVVRRVFRVNDSLPEDSNVRWQWQRGGWLLVDRTTGRITPLNLPDFDALYSVASWYRDYVAYCGVADDGKKTYAVVAELGRRKPVLKKILGEGITDNAGPDSACSVPEWHRGPVRVTFESATSKQSFAIRGHVVDVVPDTPDEEDD
jgi:hypothetical protein